MNQTSKKQTISRRVRAEAAAWIARLHGPQRTRETEDGLRRWLAEDPKHAIEFEQATDVWDDTVRPPICHAGWRSSPRRFSLHTRIAAAVTAAVVAAAAIALWMVRLADRSSITTGIGEQKTIQLADGSRVTLDTNSRITIRYSRHIRKVILQYGEVFFQVLHNPNRPFVVVAGNRKVIDVGTSFVVYRNATGRRSLSITVIKGRVAVAPLSVPDVVPKAPSLHVLFVTAGNRLVLRPHAPPSLKLAPIAQATAWLRGELFFNNVPLSSAAAQFNRYNTVKIVIGSPKLDSIRVGGIFRADANESFADAIAQAYRLRVVSRGNALILEPHTRKPEGVSAHHP